MMSKHPMIVVPPVELVNTSLLKPHPDNPRRGTVGVIVESLREHGQYRPLIVQKSTGHVLAGNHTLQAAIQTGMTEVAVTYLDVDDKEARRILLVDNRSSDLGSYDNNGLLALLQTSDEDYGSLIGTGYDTAALADLVALLEPDNPDEPIENSPGDYDPNTVTLYMTSEEHQWYQTHIGEALTTTGTPTGALMVITLIAAALNIDTPAPQWR